MACKKKWDRWASYPNLQTINHGSIELRGQRKTIQAKSPENQRPTKEKEEKERENQKLHYSKIKGKYKERTSKEKHTSNGETPKAQHNGLKKKEVSRKNAQSIVWVFFCFAFWKVKEIRKWEVLNLGQKTIEKPARNPRVIPLIPRISMRHVATLRVAPPLSIKFRTEPQESQTAQENFSSSVIFMTRHRRPQNLGGNWWEWRDYIPQTKLTLMTKKASMTKSSWITKKTVITDEGRGVIQCSQSMTWAVTKSTRQTVGSLLKVPLLDQRRYLGKH